MDADLGQGLYRKKWVVYAKRPFGKAHQVVEYLGRYTHKIAISNHRIIGINADSVTFSYKDYRTGGNKKSMTLRHSEFIRRFALHILPKRFTRIRHFGILSSTWKRGKLKTLQNPNHRKGSDPIRCHEEATYLPLLQSRAFTYYPAIWTQRATIST